MEYKGCTSANQTMFTLYELQQNRNKGNKAGMAFFRFGGCAWKMGLNKGKGQYWEGDYQLIPYTRNQKPLKWPVLPLKHFYTPHLNDLRALSYFQILQVTPNILESAKYQPKTANLKTQKPHLNIRE